MISPYSIYFEMIDFELSMLWCINALSYKTYTFFDNHKNIDVMAIIITIINFYTLRQEGADAYPLIPGWDFRGDHQTFFGLK